METINQIFLSLFEERIETNRELYLDWHNEKDDTDWTLPKIVSLIRNSQQFYFLSCAEKKPLTAKAVQSFFKEDQRYSALLYMDPKTHSVRLEGWRLKPIVAFP